MNLPSTAGKLQRTLPDITVGLMSGTSLDGVDGVVLTHPVDGPPEVLSAHHLDMPAELRSQLLALNQPGPNELHLAALAANQLAQCYASVVHLLLASAGLQPEEVRAIGAHGQTVRHQPAAPGHGTRPVSYRTEGFAPWGAYTLQLNNPALLAELTGITVVADFRSRDVAAGGQGAPLVPAFHAAVFANPQPTAVVNLGGMANVTLLSPLQPTTGFDTGPGNVLMDAWCQTHIGAAYDAGGQWAASGSVQQGLLSRLLADPYFALNGPRSTGRELFNLAWLERHLAAMTHLQPADVQATLLELTVQSIAKSLPGNLTHLVACGGGALNAHLMRRLAETCPSVSVSASDRWGIPAMDVEAAAFAWLAQQCMNGLPGNLVEVTGAAGQRVLGAIYPA